MDFLVGGSAVSTAFVHDPPRLILAPKET